MMMVRVHTEHEEQRHVSDSCACVLVWYCWMLLWIRLNRTQNRPGGIILDSRIHAYGYNVFQQLAAAADETQRLEQRLCPLFWSGPNRYVDATVCLYTQSAYKCVYNAAIIRTSRPRVSQRAAIKLYAYTPDPIFTNTRAYTQKQIRRPVHARA